MNHFLLKAFLNPERALALMTLLEHFWQAYQTALCWEGAETLEARVARLLPALMLARVDGKSPVEYLSATQQDLIRGFVIPFIQDSPASLKTLLAGLIKTLKL